MCAFLLLSVHCFRLLSFGDQRITSFFNTQPAKDAVQWGRGRGKAAESESEESAECSSDEEQPSDDSGTESDDEHDAPLEQIACSKCRNQGCAKCGRKKGAQ